MGRAPGSSKQGAEPGSRAGTRARPAGSPAMREGWGIPGDPGREGVPGRGPGVGSDGRAFSLFRCLKLAPAERCGHVTERRQSAQPLSPRSRPSAAAAGRSGGRGAAGRVRFRCRLVGSGARGPGGRGGRGPRGTRGTAAPVEASRRAVLRGPGRRPNHSGRRFPVCGYPHPVLKPTRLDFPPGGDVASLTSSDRSSGFPD